MKKKLAMTKEDEKYFDTAKGIINDALEMGKFISYNTHMRCVGIQDENEKTLGILSKKKRIYFPLTPRREEEEFGELVKSLVKAKGGTVSVVIPPKEGENWKEGETAVVVPWTIRYKIFWN
jgi:hypothetical protein